MTPMPNTEYRGKLTPNQRAQVDTHLGEGLSPRQVAKVSGLSYGRIRGYVEWKEGQVRDLIRPPATGPKILVFDIETAPYLCWTWGLWKQNVLDVEQEWFMLSFAYGWYDLETQTLGEVDWVGMNRYPGYKPNSDDDREVVRRLWELFDQADVIVGQNHERFDIKKANERFFIHGMLPPSPYATIDTKRVWTQNFSGSSALKYTTRKADVALKQSNRGFALWLDCIGGDETGWREMKQYNVADVVATAELYTRLIPWVETKYSRTVNFGHWRTGKLTCPNCGNTEDDKGFQKRGFHGTGASRFQTYRCKKCGKYSRDYRRVPQRHADDKVLLR